MLIEINFENDKIILDAIFQWFKRNFAVNMLPVIKQKYICLKFKQVWYKFSFICYIIFIIFSIVSAIYYLHGRMINPFVTRLYGITEQRGSHL